jgi:hypothetical protein
MTDRDLATYLNDHLAGSEVALELLDHLNRLVPDSAVGQFAADLKTEIAADRQALEALMARLQIAQSRTRKVAAWNSEKFTELKLVLDDRKEGALRLLEFWDALSLGIEGKRLLWRTLNPGDAPPFKPDRHRPNAEPGRRHAMGRRARRAKGGSR